MAYKSALLYLDQVHVCGKISPSQALESQAGKEASYHSQYHCQPKCRLYCKLQHMILESWQSLMFKGTGFGEHEGECGMKLCLEVYAYCKEVASITKGRQQQERQWNL